MTDILTIVVTSISCLVVIISVIIAANNSKKNHLLAGKANKLMEEANCIQAGQKFLGWHDVERYVSAIVQQMNDDGFVPTCIYTTSTRHAVIASMIGQRLLMEKNTSTIPIFVGMSVPGLRKIAREGFDVERIADWGHILIQKDLPINDSDKILIVRAHFGSGVGIRPVIDYFKDKFKIKEDNIKTACIAYPKDIPHNPPNYFCLITTGDIWFPWGKNL